jgi:hypothetical protein
MRGTAITPLIPYEDAAGARLDCNPDSMDVVKSGSGVDDYHMRPIN